MSETENTPETTDVKETATEVEHKAEQSVPPHSDDDTKSRVTNLEGIVNGLIEKVEAIAPKPGDKTPTDVPWTHRGGKS